MYIWYFLPWCVFVHFNIFSYNQDLFAWLYCYQAMLLPLPANILPQIALLLLASLLLCPNWGIMIMEHHDRGWLINKNWLLWLCPLY